jgi:hypothetical protein
MVASQQQSCSNPIAISDRSGRSGSPFGFAPLWRKIGHEISKLELFGGFAKYASI